MYYSEHYGEDNYTLTKEKFITGKVHPLITGGQISDFEDEICVDIHMVRSVVEYFYQTGEMKKEYIWLLELRDGLIYGLKLSIRRVSVCQ